MAWDNQIWLLFYARKMILLLFCDNISGRVSTQNFIYLFICFATTFRVAQIKLKDILIENKWNQEDPGSLPTPGNL
jgi:hypothetical protein